MKRAFYIGLLIATIVGGLLLGPRFLEYDGYILIVMENGTLQLSVFGFLLSALSLSLAVWLFIVVARYVLNILSGSTKWLSGFKGRRQKQALTNGLVMLFSEEYTSAKGALKKIHGADFDGVNLLAAAEVEKQLGDTEKARELWFQAAEFNASRSAAYAGLCKSYISTQQPEKALALLEDLSDKEKSEAIIVKVWVQSLEAANKWHKLKEKLPVWKKALGSDYSHWQKKVAQGEFAEIASKEGAIELKKNWQSLSRSVKKDPVQQAAYIQLLIEQGMHSDAESLLLEYQKKGPNPTLAPLFRQLRLANPSASIKTLESWIKGDDTNAELYSILGSLAYYAKDYILAEKALSRAIKLDQNQRDILLLANIKEVQHDDHQALVLYKKTLAEN